MGQQLRHLMIDGEPWFVGGDVLTILFGGASGRGWVYNKLSMDEVRKVARTILAEHGGREVNGISESGLYKLIMRSDKKTAHPFQDWVTKEVLPSIRGTGGDTSIPEAHRESGHYNSLSKRGTPAGWMECITLGNLW